MKNTLDQQSYQKLVKDLGNILLKNKEELQKAINAQMTITYWQVGKRIEDEKMTLNANYQNLILEDLERDLNLAKSTLSRAVKFFRLNPKKPKIEDALSWSHEKYLMAIKNDDLRLELSQNAKDEGWSVQKLNSKIKDLKKNDGKSKTKLKRPTAPNYLYKAKIIDVVDGDTLILNIDLGFEVIKRQRVRLAQINAPEMKTARGEKAFKYLRDLSANLDEVVVKTNKVDIYGRYLADLFYLNEEKKQGQSQAEIFTNGAWLNEDLVKAGVAEIY